MLLNSEKPTFFATLLLYHVIVVFLWSPNKDKEFEKGQIYFDLKNKNLYQIEKF